MTNYAKLLTASIALPLAVGGGFAATATTASKPPIVIGVEAPLTGDQASVGKDIARGVQLAVNQANARGGIGGRKMKLVRLDDKASPDLASAMIEKAKAKKVVAVVGPYNSSVGQINLPLYIAAGIFPVEMTSTDSTIGLSSTVQPKTEQIAPVEIDYIASTNAKSVAMLVDPSAYTQGIADSVEAGLVSKGISVTTAPVSAGANDYSAEITQALSSNPDLVYVSTYYPEGASIAKALNSANPTSTKCLMGLANVDPAFVTAVGVNATKRCVFDGIPESAQFPGKAAKTYVANYKKAFGISPGVWGIFSYDSAQILFTAVKSTSGTDYQPMFDAVRNTKAFAGATGSITIDPSTGVRLDVPLFIMTVNKAGKFIVSPSGA